MSPVAAAVEPLKAAAVDRAEQEAKMLVDRIRRELEAAGWDLDVAAPYPKSNQTRLAYQTQRGRRELFESVTRYLKPTYRVSEPRIVRMDDDRIARFIEMARQDAVTEYEAFTAKLENKIGEHAAATLHGDHVWSYSILTVTLPDGSKDQWKTRQIVNVSKLGKLYNQWPSRKVGTGG